jgi:LPS export ABC transporter protein LptC
MVLQKIKISAMIIMALLTWGCHSQEEVTSNSPNFSEIADQEGWKSTLIASKNGRRTAIIKYEHMEKFSAKKLVKFDQGVEIDFYDTNESHTSKVYSEKAILNEINNNVELMGNVVVVSDDGVNLRTEKLCWYESTGKISSDDFVMVTTAQNDTIYGYGFESDRALKKWIIKKPWGVTQKKLNLEVLDASSQNKSNENN